MYSKNDYRYYLEHQLMLSDDYLAHYGIKNMKWGKHKKKDVATEIKRGISKTRVPGPEALNVSYGANTVEKVAKKALKKKRKKVSSKYKRLRIPNIFNG